MISVALCTYNGGGYLLEQLESLAAQTLLPAEVQVGDDGSTDETLAILRGFNAPFPVRVTVNDRQLGYGENFIRTARRCTSEWVAFCDQDDVWYPDKLARCAAEFRHGVQLVAHRADGDIPAWSALPVNPALSLSPRWFRLGFCQVFRRGLLDIERVPLSWAEVADAHDIWVPFVAGMSGEIIWIDEPLASYRHHASNVSNDLGKVELLDDVATMDAASAIAGQLGFAAAAAHYGRFSTMLKDRRAVTERGSVRAFLNLLAAGAYRSGGYDRFGKRALFKDARALISRSPQLAELRTR